jgi:hypothetical protein
LVPDATNLSWLAETADGVRDKLLYLIIDDDKKLQLVQKKLENQKELTTIWTPKHRPDRIPVEEVICKGQGYQEALLSSKDFDALFWTESSIEKFLYPYYRAHRLWDEQMDRLQEQFETDDYAVAMAHRAPSKSSTLAAHTLYIGVLRESTLRWMTLDDYLMTGPRSRSSGSRAK